MGAAPSTPATPATTTVPTSPVDKTRTPVEAPAKDGKGGAGSEVPNTFRPRYLYYRLYQADGAVESRSPAHFNDRFLGRILSKAVTPPHTAASLKNYICKIEGFSGVNIYSSLTSPTALNDGARIAIMSYSGPGSYEKEPMFLLVKSAERRTSSGFPPPSVTLENPANSQYIHYRFYNQDGETPSKACFDEEDTALGRILALSIAPPFNAASLRRRLVRAEGINNNSKSLQLFENISSDEPMNDGDDIPLLTDRYPGYTVDEPMAFIIRDSSSLIPESPEVPTVQYPGYTADDAEPMEPPKVLTRFLFRFKAVSSFESPQDHPTWLRVVKGEILTSDGVEIKMVDFRKRTFNGYMMRNSAGEEGFVLHSVIVYLC